MLITKRFVVPMLAILLLTYVSSCTALSTTTTSTDVHDPISKFPKVYKLFGITPTQPVVSLKQCLKSSSSSSPSLLEDASSLLKNDNIKGYGLFANRDIEAEEKILVVPQSVCLCDDKPPRWLQKGSLFVSQEQTEYDWIIRLAAVFLDCWMKHHNDNDVADDTEDKQRTSVLLDQAYHSWLSMLTDAETFRQVLPVHWDLNTVRKTGSIELQLGVAAYHSKESNDGRAFKAKEMLQLLLQSLPDDDDDTTTPQKPSEEDCRYAMDIVESRSCRLGDNRCVVAPVFDFINHDTKANAEFSFVEQQQQQDGAATSPDDATTTTTTSSTNDDDDDGGALVVRAMRDIRKGEEICVDYGGSAAPACRSLFTYGFVNRDEPSFAFILSEPPPTKSDDAQKSTPSTRLFTVQPSSVPYDLVVTVCQLLGEKEVAMTPKVLFYLLDCATRQVADGANAGLAVDENDDDDAKTTTTTTDKVAATKEISEQLATELRAVEQQALLDFQQKLSKLAESVPRETV